MASISTKRCAHHGHREFALTYDAGLVPEPDVEWLASWLEDTVAAGEVYRPGQSLQVGWTDCRIEEAPGEGLQLMEPDWSGALPFHYVPIVTRTLAHLRLHKDVAESLEVEPTFPSIRDSGIVCNDHVRGALGLMERAAARSRDSGWFFGCDNPSHDHDDPAQLRRVSIYEAACRWAGIIPFAALPQGTEVVFSDGKPLSLKVAGRHRDLRCGSLLGRAASAL